MFYKIKIICLLVSKYSWDGPTYAHAKYSFLFFNTYTCYFYTKVWIYMKLTWTCEVHFPSTRMMDCLHIEIRTEEILAIDYYHLHLLDSWQLQLQHHRLYDVWFHSVHFGLTTRSVPSTGLEPLVGSELVMHQVYL